VISLDFCRQNTSFLTFHNGFYSVSCVCLLQLSERQPLSTEGNVVYEVSRQMSEKRHLPSVTDFVSWIVTVLFWIFSLFTGLIDILQKNIGFPIHNGFQSVCRLQMFEDQPSSTQENVADEVSRQKSEKRHLPSRFDIVSFWLWVLRLLGDLTSCLHKYARIRIPNGFHSVDRLQISEGQPSSMEWKVEDVVEMNESTQEKDLGHSTHAGGLYPKSAMMDQTDQEDPEGVYDWPDSAKYTQWSYQELRLPA